MKFFVPHTNDVQGQEQLYRLIRGNVESQVGAVAPRRIFRAAFRRDGEERAAEVGRPEPLTADDVFAIFLAADGSALYLCTPTWGMFNDRPVAIPAADILSVEDFEAG